MFLEAVTVSVNYADFLVWFLIHNKNIFNKLVVVTSEKDWETQNLCRHFNVECVKTNIFEKDFPKGQAINLGLNRLERKEFICHIDSDIILPPRTKEMFEIAQPRHDTIYSILRMNCIGYDNWIKFFNKPHFIHEKEIYVHLDAFPMGALVCKTYDKDVDFKFEKGFMPIGYFQMWSEKNGVHLSYPEEHQDCSRADMTFSLINFPKRENRQLIPEVVCIHLLGEDTAANKGMNWNGRTCKRFGPTEL